MLSRGLKKILVRYGTCIYCIVFQDSSGTYSTKFGTDCGDRIVEVSVVVHRRKEHFVLVETGRVIY